MNVDFASAMRNRRQEQRTAVAQWRRTSRAYQPPRPTPGGTLFACLGAWIADHFVALYLLTLAAAFVAGCLTGKLV